MVYTFIIVFGVFFALELYMQLFRNYCEPYFDKKEKIIKRKRNTEGVYKTKFTNIGYFRINNEGWNSHRNYYQNKENKKGNTKDGKRNQETVNGKRKLRIAIIGHSNIEGLRVPVDSTLSKILEDDLSKKGIPAEVYTFGYGGMHLAQAMHVSRYVVQKFHPDILIIGTLLDDFWVHSTRKIFFLNLNIDSVNNIQEVLPEKFIYEKNSLFSIFYFSKLVYYFDKKTRIGEKINDYFKKKSNFNNEVEDQKIICKLDQIKAFRYIFNEFNKITKVGSKDEIPLFFLKFPLAIPSYNFDYKELHLSAIEQENQLKKNLHEYCLRIIDLKKVFMDDYAINSQRFDFKNDYHYNKRAHKLIGLKLSDFIQLYLGENN